MQFLPLKKVPLGGNCGIVGNHFLLTPQTEKTTMFRDCHIWATTDRIFHSHTKRGWFAVQNPVVEFLHPGWTGGY